MLPRLVRQGTWWTVGWLASVLTTAACGSSTAGHNADAAAPTGSSGASGSGSSGASGSGSSGASGSGSSGASGSGSSGASGSGSSGASGSGSSGTSGSATPTGTFAANLRGRGSATVTIKGVARTVALYVPPTVADNAPLIVAFHGTGGTGLEMIGQLRIEPLADQNGFIVIAPDAIKGRRGGAFDVDHWTDGAYMTGWNLGDPDPSTNDDMLLTAQIIAEARQAFGIDPRRVYSVGFSNGAFFAPFVAFRMPGQIAAFAEMSGGAIRCANRGNDQFKSTANTCEAMKAEPGYPHCTGPLKPSDVPAGRVPPGYLSHCKDDYAVSVAWSCTLLDALGSHGTMDICSESHQVVGDFSAKAWAFLSGHKLP